MTPRELTQLVRTLEPLESRAPLETLREALSRLDLSRDDLAPYCRFSEEGYQRNIIRRTDLYELVVLCWRPGQRTPIHDHEGSTCGFLIVEGVATEVRYARDEEGVVRLADRRRMRKGEVCASQDADIHEVANLTDRDLITLHCYSPPILRFHRYEEGSREAVIEEVCAEAAPDEDGAAADA